MKAAENAEENLQNIFGAVSAEKQYKKYAGCVVGKHSSNHISHVSLN